MHLLGEPVDFSPCIAEDDSLGDRDGLIKITESVKLPLLLLNSNVKLLNTFERQFITLDEDTDGVAHKLFGHLKYVCRHGSGKEDDLGVLGKELENLVNLVLEATRKHLVSFIETKLFDVVRAKSATIYHVIDATGGADDDVDTLLKFRHVIADISATDTRVAFDVHVVAKRDHDFLYLLCKLTGWGKNECLSSLD